MVATWNRHVQRIFGGQAMDVSSSRELPTGIWLTIAANRKLAKWAQGLVFQESLDVQTCQGCWWDPYSSFWMLGITFSQACISPGSNGVYILHLFCFLSVFSTETVPSDAAATSCKTLGCHWNNKKNKPSLSRAKQGSQWRSMQNFAAPHNTFPSLEAGALLPL